MRSKHKPIIIAFTLTLLILLVIYFGMAFYFKSHFFIGSSINGIDSSRQGVEAVEGSIRREVKNYVLQIDGRNKITDAITDDDIDYESICMDF